MKTVVTRETTPVAIRIGCKFLARKTKEESGEPKTLSPFGSFLLLAGILPEPTLVATYHVVRQS